MSIRAKQTCLIVLMMIVVGAAFAEGPAEGIYRGWSRAVQFDISPPLYSMTPRAQAGTPANLVDPEPDGLGPLGPQDTDPIVQGWVASESIPAPIISFDALSQQGTSVPPDPMGDVGPNHYVAMANRHFSVLDKTGTLLSGPWPNNQLWDGFGGTCETRNDGDPIVLHDQLADRWILTQFTAEPDLGGDYYNCVAISTTPDPTGSYYRYAFSTGDFFPDYPKYGVWPNAYFISTREFEYIGASGYYRGVGAYAISREEMIAGDPSPMMIEFYVPRAGNSANLGDGLLPADLDGNTLPPADGPHYFVGSMDNGAGYGAPQDALTVWEFFADFETPANSSFALVNTLSMAPFDTMFSLCSGFENRECIPQPDTDKAVDILSYRQRPMHRLAYRNFGTHESLVTNQSVEASAGMAGMRWWEIRDPGGAPFIHQEGTYAPGTSDGIHRWMGSIGMDHSGNMALGYSASNGTSTYPSVWYTGRLATDPAGVMSQGEGSIVDGGGSQLSNYHRWGDYTSMNIDPYDDCTFWYINEYYASTSGRGWRLRVGAFRFDECVPDYGPLFVDGFESGDTTAWDNETP